MSAKKYLFTSESVTEGHPDKICDMISDAVLDEVLKQDANSRVACETCCTTNTVMVMGEITSKAKIDVESIVRRTIKNIGYDKAEYGFCYDTVNVIVKLHEQSSDISQGVTTALEVRQEKSTDEIDTVGAGDQGMMFGYAVNETEELMPLPLTLAHALTARLTQARKTDEIKYLRPDGKSQVTVAYENGQPSYIDAIVVSTQHDENITSEQIEHDIMEKIIKPVIDKKMLTDQTKYYVNPTGKFVIGGPHGDSGLTGRKIIVDTYGGACPHGGGAFSGKDSTKVDRSACYYARYVCKNIVKAGLADKVQLQVAYAIGKAKPISLNVNTFGTGKYSDEKIVKAIEKVFDFRPLSIINSLGLKSPVYSQTASNGHFGKKEFAWEKTDKVNELIEAIKL